MNSVANEEVMQIETIVGNIYPKLLHPVSTKGYKELLEEVLNEPIDTNALPIPWLLEDLGLEQMQNTAGKFREALKQFPDSDSEMIQPMQRENTAPAKVKVGRPKGSVKKERFKAPQNVMPNVNEDEKELLEKFRIVKEHVRRGGGQIKARRSLGIFGVGLINAKSINIAPEIKERLFRAGEFLD